jgi:nucleotide-binding universal stress UspA family protein
VRHYKTGDEIVVDKAYEQNVTKEMHETFSEILNPLTRYTIKVKPGIPWEQILKWAREIKTNLIVLGAHTKRAEQSGIARVAGRIGTTIEEVILRERCPVMIVNDPVRKEQLGFNRILVPVDFSESCEYALRFASDMAEKTGGSLIAFHMTYEKLATSANEKKQNMLQSTLKNIVQKFPHTVPCDYIVRGGISPSIEILKVAAEKGADMIIMGSHTRKEPDKPYVGSAVVEVSCQSLRPVIVVNAYKALAQAKKRINQPVQKPALERYQSA